MWLQWSKFTEWVCQFFRIALSHESLVSFYKVNFQLTYNYHYSLTELDNMMPWEREVYVSLLINELEKEAKRAQNSHG